MKAEIRADGLHISGYVNIPGRMSRPVITRKYGKVIETIEQRAFQRALEKADNIVLKLDHDRVIAGTADKTLEAYEDEVGLRANAIISDSEVIEGAKHGKLRGWSFDMKDIIDELEERAEGLPIRHVKDFTMSEITLAMNKIPCYSSTSIELRADDEESETETRAFECDFAVTDKRETNKPNLKEYQNRINKLKTNK